MIGKEVKQMMKAAFIPTSTIFAGGPRTQVVPEGTFCVK